ncbi:MAG: response regulator [bacterium]|nr:response regulator [bacterium]
MDGRRGQWAADPADHRGGRRWAIPAQTPPIVVPLLMDMPLPSICLAGRRILVVDDDPVCRDLTAGILRDAGAAVELANDGRSAVLAVAAGAPDLVVTDLDMPGVDGLAAAGIVRWDLGLADLPIIAVSAGLPSPADLLATGVNACLGKPVSESDLLAATANCLEPGLATPFGSVPAGGGADFDAKNAQERMGGRKELLRRMVGVFTREHGDTGRRLDTALAGGELAGARRICHALRGTGASLGARRLQSAAAACEEILAVGRQPDAALVTELHRALATALAAMAAWSAAAPASS